MAHGVIAAGFRRIAADKYICGGCQSRVIDCTAHCIREKVLDKVFRLDGEMNELGMTEFT